MIESSKISVIIIAKNAEGLIAECLESVKWANEVILIDSGSEDKTKEIAEKKGAKVFEIQTGSFSEWRNLGATKASNPWLLYVDADERVTPPLKEEIERTITAPKDNAYAIPRRNNLLGHDMKYGGWWPDYVLRLIKKEAFIKWEGDLHEQPQIKGSVGKLQNYLYHITHRSLTEMMDKTNVWSEVEAKLLFDAHHPQMTWWRFFSVAGREFWYRGIVKLGFLDGPIGVIEINYQMISRMITYAKLWEMQINNKKA